MKLRYLVFACSLLIVAKGAGSPATGSSPSPATWPRDFTTVSPR